MTTSRQGFTLIEISFALLVASIGLLGIMGLFPTGIAMNKMAHDETRAAMFAEEVLNGIRAQAAITRWDLISAKGIRLPPPTPDVWANKDDLYVEPGEKILKFETIGSMSEGGSRYTDYVIRYNLRITKINDFSNAVYLDIRRGEHDTNVLSRYYMEIYNHGQ